MKSGPRIPDKEKKILPFGKVVYYKQVHCFSYKWSNTPMMDSTSTSAWIYYYYL